MEEKFINALEVMNLVCCILKKQIEGNKDEDMTNFTIMVLTALIGALLETSIKDNEGRIPNPIPSMEKCINEAFVFSPNMNSFN